MKQKAFTLIELLVVIVIIGILSTIGIATYEDMREKARIAKAIGAADQLEKLFLAENLETWGETFTGWYSFDTLNTSTPFVEDKSGAGNHLTVAAGTGSQSISTDSPLGTGSSLRADTRMLYRGVGTTAVGGKFTVGMWVKMNSFPASFATPFRLGDATMLYIYPDGEIRPFVAPSSSSSLWFITNQIIKDNWHYLVWSYDGVDTLRLWVDGELVQEASSGSVGSFPYEGSSIGIAHAYGSDTFDGWVDDVMFFPFAYDGEALH